MNDFEHLLLDGPAAIEEAMANTWTSATEQERERILSKLNESGVLYRMPKADMNLILDVVMKIKWARS